MFRLVVYPDEVHAVTSQVIVGDAPHVNVHGNVIIHLEKTGTLIHREKRTKKKKLPSVMSLPPAAELIRLYNEVLMAQDGVRALARAVTQDPQTETVDFVTSRGSVRVMANSLNDEGSARRAIIAWLNAVYFSDVDGPPGLPMAWWWEMHTRIQKLLVISMILEGDNLRSFGAQPEIFDIPQCLIYLADKITQLRKTRFPLLKTTFESTIQAMIQEEKEFGQSYLACYTEAKK